MSGQRGSTLYIAVFVLGIALLVNVGCGLQRVITGDEASAPTVALSPLALEELLEAVNDDDPDVRCFAVIELTRRGQQAAPAVPALIRLLDDPNDNIRSSAAEALGKIGPAAAAAVEPLARLLTSGNLDSRRAAAQALGCLGELAEPALPQLRLALSDRDEDVRLAAIDALGKIGPAALPAVSDLLQLLARSGDKVVRQRVRLSLHRIDPTALARLQPAS